MVAHLVGPGARDASELLHAPPQLDILMRGVKVPEAVLDMRGDSSQHLPAHDHPRTSHAEVLVILQ